MIKQRVTAAGYLALTKEEFIAKISNFYMFQTGIGTNMLLMTVISFIVGLSISGPDLLHLHHREPRQVRRAQGDRRQGAASSSSMILFQASFVALTGYGLGVGLCALHHLAGAAQSARLRGDHHLRQPRARIRHGGGHRGDLQLRRRAPGAAHRALRHLPGLSHGERRNRGRRRSTNGSARARPGRTPSRT